MTWSLDNLLPLVPTAGLPPHEIPHDLVVVVAVTGDAPVGRPMTIVTGAGDKLLSSTAVGQHLALPSIPFPGIISLSRVDRGIAAAHLAFVGAEKLLLLGDPKTPRSQDRVVRPCFRRAGVPQTVGKCVVLEAVHVYDGHGRIQWYFVREPKYGTRGDYSKAGYDVVQPVEGRPCQHAAIGGSCHVHAVLVETVVFAHVVHNSPNEGDVIIAAPAQARVGVYILNVLTRSVLSKIYVATKYVILQ